MIYAHNSRLRTKQLLGDLALLLWCLLWAFLGRAAYRLILALREPAEQLQGAAAGLSGRVADINDSLPSFLQGNLGSISGGADSIGDAATAQAESVTHVASVVGWTIALIPIGLALLIAVFFRVRWNLAVRSATKFRHNDNYEELLARRAVMHQPLGALAGVSDDPLRDVREGNHAALARLELAELGVNPIKSSRSRKGPGSARIAPSDNQLSKPPS